METKVRKSFIFNVSWQEVLIDYPAEVRLEVYDAVIRYAASGTLSEMKPLAKMAFSFIKKEIDYNNEKYNETIVKRSEAGRKGMLSRYGKQQTLTKLTNDNKPNKTNKCYQDLTNLTNLTEDVDDNENVNDINPPVYIPPLQGGNTHTELSVSDNPTEQDNCVTTESPPVAEEKEKSSAKKEKEHVKRFQKPTIEEVKAYIAEKGYDVDAERFWNFYEAKDWFIGKNKMKNWHAAVATWQKKETDYVDIRQKRHDRRRGSEIRATCAEDYSEPL